MVKADYFDFVMDVLEGMEQTDEVAEAIEITGKLADAEAKRVASAAKRKGEKAELRAVIKNALKGILDATPRSAEQIYDENEVFNTNEKIKSYHVLSNVLNELATDGYCAKTNVTYNKKHQVGYKVA